jgi:hypothetical protein
MPIKKPVCEELTFFVVFVFFRFASKAEWGGGMMIRFTQQE